jgi:KTSC domain
MGLVPKILVLLLIAAFFTHQRDIPAAAAAPNHIVWVKYRQTPVNVADRCFEYLDTSRSSFITGAWYDGSNSYMVIGLRGTYYHYCRMPSNAWNAFRAADSFGRHYNAFIKGNFDCRLGGVPVY